MLSSPAMGMDFVTSPGQLSGRHCYTVFRTAWGWVGFASIDGAVIRFALPDKSRSRVEQDLRRQCPDARFSDKLQLRLQHAVQAYFAGADASFQCRVDISWASPFGQKVLRRCARIAPGRSISYAQLATRCRHPRAARAVGRVMASNRLTLLIPCHRVIRTDGSLGGYSAPQGLPLKERLLAHEETCWSS